MTRPTTAAQILGFHPRLLRAKLWEMISAESSIQTHLFVYSHSDTFFTSHYLSLGGIETG